MNGVYVPAMIFALFIACFVGQYIKAMHMYATTDNKMYNENGKCCSVLLLSFLVQGFCAEDTWIDMSTIPISTTSIVKPLKMWALNEEVQDSILGEINLCNDIFLKPFW